MRHKCGRAAARGWMFVLLLPLASLPPGCSKEATPLPPLRRPAPQMSVVTVTTQTIPSTVSFVAQTESSQQVESVARVSGYLDKLGHAQTQADLLNAVVNQQGDGRRLGK
jgi:multidrug efflux pump subunit AcrA (membrane-fusion protein)